MRNPDKHIRKAAIDLLHNMVVSGETIPCLDYKAVGPTLPYFYVLITSQTKRSNRVSKCGTQWECSILFDVIARYEGIVGSRLMVNDMEEKLHELLEGFTIPDLFSFDMESSESFDSSTSTESVFRQLVRYNIVINN